MEAVRGDFDVFFFHLKRVVLFRNLLQSVYNSTERPYRDLCCCFVSMRSLGCVYSPRNSTTSVSGCIVCTHEFIFFAA